MITLDIGMIVDANDAYAVGKVAEFSRTLNKCEFFCCMNQITDDGSLNPDILKFRSLDDFAEYGGFSALRNKVISQANSHYVTHPNQNEKWMLFLDADDDLDGFMNENYAAYIEYLRRFQNHTLIEALTTPILSVFPDGGSRLTEMFRLVRINGRSLFYSGLVHEDIRRRGGFTFKDFGSLPAIIHNGYVDEEHTKRSRERNFALLQKEIEYLKAGKKYGLSSLGICYFYLGKSCGDNLSMKQQYYTLALWEGLPFNLAGRTLNALYHNKPEDD